MLVGTGANIHATDEWGSTPLHYSAVHMEVSQMLVGAGADVNATDAYGRTPLHRSAWRGHGDVSRMLIAA